MSITYDMNASFGPPPGRGRIRLWRNGKRLRRWSWEIDWDGLRVDSGATLTRAAAIRHSTRYSSRGWA